MFLLLHLYEQGSATSTTAFLKHASSLYLVIEAHPVFLLRTRVGIPRLPLTVFLEAHHLIFLNLCFVTSKKREV